MGLVQLHLPALQVIVPMLVAPLVMLMARSPRAAWATATLTSWLTLTITLLLLIRVQAEGVVTYHMGGWLPPVGIEYRVDAVNILVLLVISFISAVVMPFARLSVANEVREDKHCFFYAAFLLANCGLLGITITGDAFNIFVFFEIAALASYSLIATGRERRAVMASYQYLMMGTIGTTFLLIGIGFLYIMTGTLNLVDLSVRLPEVNDTRTVRAALAFIVVGISLKLALFPLHLWLPNAYAFAPSMVTVFLSATATKVAIYVLMRFIFGVFGYELSFNELEMNLLLMPLAMLGILIPSIVAIFHTNIKRMFAYSSVAQVGYIILGISFASTLGLMASVLHLFNHAITKAALFMALGCIAYRLGGVSLVHMTGAGQRMPWTMTAFVIAGLSLIGVPLTAGFVTKWHLILAALDGGLWPIAVFLLGTSVLALLYVWRVVEVAFFRAPLRRIQVREAPLSLLLPTWFLTLACLYFGIETSLPVGLAERAAETLMGGYR
ncbi:MULTISPECIES: monovalent cation/H+ antiporter subunit D family protein [Halomonas]|uniref:Na(+)/H(+) antiporter subunit D n=1 Tax=Halomonas chromatireducens TaxID=507626 RepID=A0A120JW61_9GAMM|nr:MULTISPECIES: monovalent cation/H+ antiporter subunit D family protein [Halomonas]AMD01297.1 Na(+)/H(+) antiporter subunit D [Halomonas chromatireducens]MBZ0329912.1 monovalent cation/H+ antiporter subunit D family protein [Halomonas sp. ANAO-440]